MIATVREDLAIGNRESIYALRRVLVRRLQVVSAQVNRRERVRLQRAFIAEWGTFKREGRLDLLRRATRLGPAIAAEAGAAWRTSLLLELAAQGAGLRVIPGEAADPGQNVSKILGDRTQSGVDWEATRADSHSRQGDLFQHQAPLARAG
jgi:hypothetical protein